MFRRQMRRAERDGHGECRAAADLAFDADGAAVQLDQFLHQREADAGAFERAALLAFDAMEALEQPRQFAPECRRRCRARSVPRRADPPSCAAATAISPSKVNLNALERRLRTIFSHMSRST